MSVGLIVLSGLLLAAWPPLAVATGDGSPEAEIVVEQEPLAGGAVRLTATARYTGTARGLTYRFETVSEGASGRSRTVQSGEVLGGTALAVSSAVVRPGEGFTARLTLLRGERIIEEVDWERGGR